MIGWGWDLPGRKMNLLFDGVIKALKDGFVSAFFHQNNQKYHPVKFTFENVHRMPFEISFFMSRSDFSDWTMPSFAE